jgi:flavorubredoxin
MSTLDTPLQPPLQTGRRLEPVNIAPETFVLQGIVGEGEGPLAVHMNSMVIRGQEPVVVDTGIPTDRERYLDDLFSLVEPQDVRWVFISHDDVDHYGNVDAVMAACPNATLVASWFLAQRLGPELEVSPTRCRWVNDGESLDAGDRTLLALRPPLYDSPTTRGLLDPTTGVYWASDCFATPVASATPYVDELDPEEWAQGFAVFQKWNSPWVDLLDTAGFGAEVERLRAHGLRTIATCHGPTIGAASIDRAFELMHSLPAAEVPPQPGQPVLDEIVAALEVHDRLGATS